MPLTTEDRVRMRELAAEGLDAAAFEGICENMLKSIAKRKSLTPEQNEAYVLAFFDTLMNKFLDVRNRLLAEIRRV